MNLIDTIVLIRNYCAHGDILFDMRTPRGISKIPEIEFENDDRSSLNACIKVVLFFLGKVSENRKEELDSELKIIFENLYEIEELKDIIHRLIKYKS
jgi:abortive infection bacteriophage resistance protein